MRYSVDNFDAFLRRCLSLIDKVFVELTNNLGQKKRKSINENIIFYCWFTQVHLEESGDSWMYTVFFFKAKVHILIRSPQFLPKVFFVFYDSIQDSHYSQPLCLLRLFLAVTVSQTFLIFDDLDNVEECLPGILQIAPQLRFVSCLHWSYGFLERRPQK